MTPSAIESEHALLSVLLRRPGMVTEVIGKVRPSDFMNPENAQVFDAITLLHNAGTSIDAATVTDHLRKAGSKIDSSSLMKLRSAKDFSEDSLSDYAGAIARTSGLRSLLDMAAQVTESAADDGADPVSIRESIVRPALSLASGVTKSVTLRDVTEKILADLKNPPTWDDASIIPSGLDFLDTRHKGFRRNTFCVIGARPGVGKSAMGKQICSSLDERGFKTLFVSLEMESREIGERVIAERAGIDAALLEIDPTEGAQVNDRELQKITEVVEGTGDNFRMSTPTGAAATIEGIANEARLQKAQGGLDVLCVDYIQLLEKSDPRKSDYETVTAASKALKQLSRELNIVVIAMAQLNRESDKGKPRRPRKSDLRDSGSIEQDADVVMLLHESLHFGSRKTEVIVDKFRNSTTSVDEVVFDGPTTSFRGVAAEDLDNYDEDLAAF